MKYESNVIIFCKHLLIVVAVLIAFMLFLARGNNVAICYEYKQQILLMILDNN